MRSVSPRARVPGADQPRLIRQYDSLGAVPQGRLAKMRATWDFTVADRPVKLGARGWDNQLWRLGDDLAVRLPWATQTADALLLKEHAWLPALAPRLPLPVPVPQRLGEPSDRFPRPWIVTTWVPGESADRAPATRAAEAADTPAAFLTALHRRASEGAPAGRGRGGPPADHAEGVANGLASATEMGLIPDPDAVRAVWEDAAAAPEWAGPARWLHGDLHPADILTADGTFRGVIDFGELCAGDPACDLAAPLGLAAGRRRRPLPCRLPADPGRRDPGRSGVVPVITWSARTAPPACRSRRRPAP